MPDVGRVIAAFDGQPVAFCAVNQAETPPIIAEFLEQREWTDLPVGLDFRMDVSNDYLVKGIPHTVVIDREGTVSWVHTGYDEQFANDLADAIGRALQPSR